MRDLERAGPMGVGGGTIGPLRQPDRAADPVSQWVSLGTVLDNLLKRLERDMNEAAITKP